MDGVDVLATAILPSISTSDPLIRQPPEGLRDVNRTRSIVGAVVTSGIPYMGVATVCKKLPNLCPRPAVMGYVAVYLPRLWMFLLSMIGDALLLRVFAVYETENAIPAVITYASTWTSLIAITRNSNFALETLCLTGIVAACFGWKPGTARPLFWLSATALALGTFLRPIFFVFLLTPLIYLSSLWGKPGVALKNYILGAIEGLAVFAFWATIWVTVDSLYFGTFKIRFGETVVESFDMFLDNVGAGKPFSYKGSLVYAPINAMWTVMNRKYLKTIAQNTTPGQMFLSLPGILGPLFIVLMRESYKGMLVAVKELMSELKAATNSGSKKGKKKKAKKATAAKEREDELLVFFDTIQTTLLLGLLLEVLQNHTRLGILSLLSLVPVSVMCMAGSIFGEKSSQRFRILHIVFTIGMVIFYGFLNQAGVQRTMLSVGSGGVDAIARDSHVVFYKSNIGHRSIVGPNVKNITFHSGGESRLNLMTKLRELKERDDYHEDRLFVCAAATVEMKDTEFAHVAKLATGHMSTHDMPQNIDQALKKSTLQMYKFIGDEDEAIIRDSEEAAEEEEREKEKKEEKGRRSGKDEL